MPDSDSVGGSPAGPDPNTKKLIFDKYELGKLLGCGAFAKVYHARDLATNHSVAVKVIPKSRISKSGLSRHITREIAILRRLRHPDIVRLLEVLASRTKIYFVLEFAKGGELFARVEKFGRLPEHLTRKYFQQLISAVGYCHSRGVFHRDLKPENLLLDEKDDLRVSDFGLSAISDQTRPDNGDGLFHTLCGTPAYVAPEILAKKGYDGAKVDIWSCGVILYVLNAGYLPFNDPNLMNLYRKIYCGQYRIPKWTSPDLKRLISRTLDTNPETRISVDEIMHDPWFKRGLDREKWTAMMRFHDDEKEEEMEERELNAFDLISFSSGVNLSGLFDSGSDRERFVSGEGAEDILGRVEELGRRVGCFVERKGQNGKGGVVVRGQNGNLVARVRVYRLIGGYMVVEVDKGEDRWAQEFWREKVGPAIKGGGVGVEVGGGHRRTPVEGSSGDPPAPVSCLLEIIICCFFVFV